MEKPVVGVAADVAEVREQTYRVTTFGSNAARKGLPKAGRTAEAETSPPVSEKPALDLEVIHLNKKRYFTMAVVLLIGAALVGLAGWGYTRSAVASPGREQAEGRSIKARNHSHDWLYRLRGERHRFFRFDDGEESRGDRDDSTPTTGGVTPPTTAGTTTTTVQTTTTTTQATTTTTQATTTTTVRPTTTTTQATTTTTAINGGALFATTCRGCHGAGGTPISSTLTASQVLTKITTGSMSGYASGLSSAQKSAVATYVAGGGR